MPLTINARVSIFYEYKGKGFSESLWSDAGQDGAKAAIPAYLVKRLAFADDQMLATYARISDPNNPRRVLFLDLKDQPGNQGAIKEDGCSPSDVILLRMLTATNAPSHFFIHCFPAAFLKEDVVVPTGKWFDKLEAWSSYMGSQASPWKMRNAVPRTLADRKPIAGAAPLKPRGVRYTCPDVPALAVGDKVMIGGTSSDGVGYRGLKVVHAVDITNKAFVVGGASPVGDLGANSYYSKVNYIDNPIKSIQAVRLTERKVGRPFALPVGRRAATLSLRR